MPWREGQRARLRVDQCVDVVTVVRALDGGRYVVRFDSGSRLTVPGDMLEAVR